MRVARPVFVRARPLVVAMAALFATCGAHAGLFEDEDARRAILDLRQLRTQDAEANSAKVKALEAQIDQLKRSMLDLNAQVEQMRGELAQQRGQGEVLLRDVSEMQRKQKDMQAAQDERLRKLEPQVVTVDGKTFKADPDEKRAYDDAMARMRAADFAAGVDGLVHLLQQYPQTGYKEAAWYWQGNGYYGLRQYKESIQAFKHLVDKAPDHVRTPEAMLSIANCQTELKDMTAARKTLEQLVKQYPQTEAAQAARDRLLTMPGGAAPARNKGK